MNPGTLMTREAVWERLRSLLIEVGKIDPDLATEAASIDEEITLESVAFVEIAVIIEEDLDIELDPLEILDRKLLGNIVDYIHTTAAALSAQSAL